jgi:hypothetical protein
MSAADLRALADFLDLLAAAGFTVALEIGGDLIIRARPATVPAAGEPFSNGTRFDDGTGWIEGGDER